MLYTPHMSSSPCLNTIKDLGLAAAYVLNSSCPSPRCLLCPPSTSRRASLLQTASTSAQAASSFPPLPVPAPPGSAAFLQTVLCPSLRWCWCCFQITSRRGSPRPLSIAIDALTPGDLHYPRRQMRVDQDSKRRKCATTGNIGHSHQFLTEE
jgi:hypothetical protein